MVQLLHRKADTKQFLASILAQRKESLDWTGRHGHQPQSRFSFRNCNTIDGTAW